MKIGIDARPLSNELTGIGRYTLNIINELFKLDETIQWYLYSDRPLIVHLGHSNVNIRVGSNSASFTSTLYAQYVFPYWALKDKLDIFWSPRHHLPLALVFLKNVRKVVTIHDIVWKRHPETMTKMGLILEKLLFPLSVLLADSVIAVSEFTAKELAKEFKHIESKTISIPLQSFISDELLVKKHQPYITGRYILFVGTLEPRKNLDNLLKAFKQIVQSQEGIILVIAGKDGWGDVKTSLLVKSLELEDKIVITGFVSDEHLLSLYKHCTILAMPSVYEGFGLPALEALAMKKKVVVSKFNAIAEIGGDNIFITDTDAFSIAVTLNKALNSIPKNLAQVDNDWSKVARNTLEILYTSAMQSP
jgi:glycosyltransferase involved in cell wall biosynthesis